MSTLIYITGSPGTGKTTLSTLISSRLSQPLLGRDNFKESLWDSWQTDQNLIDLVSRAHWGTYYSALTSLLKAGMSLVCEGAVHSEHGTDELRQMIEMSRLIIIHCYTSRQISHHRFVERAKKVRHPAHHDAELVADIHLNAGRWSHFESPVEIDVPLLLVNTSEGYDSTLEEILNFIESKA